MALSFCYMTFVIKDNLEDVRRQCHTCVGNVFDPEPYTYLFNKSTTFLDGDFVRNDHTKLEHTLQHLNKINPEFIFQLNYSQQLNRNEHGRASHIDQRHLQNQPDQQLRSAGKASMHAQFNEQLKGLGANL